MKITVQPRRDESELGYLKVRFFPSSTKRYFKGEPTATDHTDYVNRRLRCGDLVEVKPAKPAPKKKEG